jgi:uncharacterized protein
MAFPAPQPVDEAAIEAFDALCSRLARFDDRIATEWADGYFTALLAGARTIMPSEWLPKMFGDAFGRAFADPTDAAQAMSTLMARWNMIAAELHPDTLLDDPEALRLRPLMLTVDAEDRQRLVDSGELSAADIDALDRTGALWAVGFLDAIDDFAADWQLPPDAGQALEHLEQCLHCVRALTLDDAGVDEYLRESYPGQQLGRDELIDEACYAVQDLRLLWLDHAVRTPPRRVEAAPGRNDPCPCGSGKKYKRCHGAGGALH